MNDVVDLNPVVCTWKSLNRGTAEERKLAEKYYRNEVFPLVVSGFVVCFNNP